MKERKKRTCQNSLSMPFTLGPQIALLQDNKCRLGNCTWHNLLKAAHKLYMPWGFDWLSSFAELSGWTQLFASALPQTPASSLSLTRFFYVRRAYYCNSQRVQLISVSLSLYFSCGMFWISSRQSTGGTFQNTRAQTWFQLYRSCLRCVSNFQIESIDSTAPLLSPIFNYNFTLTFSRVVRMIVLYDFSTLCISNFEIFINLLMYHIFCWTKQNF